MRLRNTFIPLIATNCLQIYEHANRIISSPCYICVLSMIRATNSDCVVCDIVASLTNAKCPISELYDSGINRYYGYMIIIRKKTTGGSNPVFEINKANGDLKISSSPSRIWRSVVKKKLQKLRDCREDARSINIVSISAISSIQSMKKFVGSLNRVSSPNSLLRLRTFLRLRTYVRSRKRVDRKSRYCRIEFPRQVCRYRR